MKLFRFTVWVFLCCFVGEICFAQNIVATAIPQVALTKQAKAHTVIFVLERSGVFEVFLSAIRQVGLEEKLLKEGPYTIFAPSDAAFVHVASVPREELFANKTLLKKFVEQHIVAGKFNLADLAKLSTITALSGSILQIEQKDPLEIGHASVSRADIEADNGVIHMLAYANLQE